MAHPPCSPKLVPLSSANSPSTPHRQIKLQTGLQAIAIRATLGKTITVCSIYLPPTMLFNSTDLENLIAQLPPPILLLGDFNAHSTLWQWLKWKNRGGGTQH